MMLLTVARKSAFCRQALQPSMDSLPCMKRSTFTHFGLHWKDEMQWWLSGTSPSQLGWEYSSGPPFADSNQTTRTDATASCSGPRSIITRSIIALKPLSKDPNRLSEDELLFHGQIRWSWQTVKALPNLNNVGGNLQCGNFLGVWRL